MSDLVVLDFDGVGTADEVLTKLPGAQKKNFIDREDACVVARYEPGVTGSCPTGDITIGIVVVAPRAD